jgi:septal ring factor EnvC (AmiA/AmiB activator)
MAFASISKLIYGPTPEERVKAWQTQLKKETRMLDREIRQLDSALSKTRTQLKQLANKGDVKNAKTLAREVVRSNKQKDRLNTSKAMMNSVNMQLQHQLGQQTLQERLEEYAEMCVYSNRQDHWDPTEVDRDHEAQQSAGEATAAASDHAQYEYGDDEGIHTSTAYCSGSLLLILTPDSAGRHHV